MNIGIIVLVLSVLVIISIPLIFLGRIFNGWYLKIDERLLVEKEILETLKRIEETLNK